MFGTVHWLLSIKFSVLMCKMEERERIVQNELYGKYMSFEDFLDALSEDDYISYIKDSASSIGLISSIIELRRENLGL